MLKPDLQNRVAKAIELIGRYGMIDGEHHKQWILDQTLRTLLGRRYKSWINNYNSYTNKNGDGYDPWDEGIAP